MPKRLPIFRNALLHLLSLVLCLPFPRQGGIAFVAIKGALKVYFRQQQYLIQANRRILNFVEKENVDKDAVAQLEEDSGSEAGLS